MLLSFLLAIWSISDIQTIHETDFAWLSWTKKFLFWINDTLKYLKSFVLFLSYHNVDGKVIKVEVLLFFRVISTAEWIILNTRGVEIADINEKDEKMQQASSCLSFFSREDNNNKINKYVNKQDVMLQIHLSFYENSLS